MFPVAAVSQYIPFSGATDAGVQYNFSRQQRFVVLNHTLQAQLHINRRDALYVWLAYTTTGRFKNKLTASARSVSQSPQSLPFQNKSSMQFRHFSIGWKRYLKGTYDAERLISVYALAGFGILFGNIKNQHMPAVDTSLYAVPVLFGRSQFTRLTYDAGMGAETPLGTDAFLYGEIKCWLVADGYPSMYLVNNNRTPRMGMLNLGIRILF
ncbi:MAG: hypothetical protein N2747_00205 [Chitinophagaceae bacterium]|nr:hypothetical protein [Chitinophagaceae bacterium]